MVLLTGVTSGKVNPLAAVAMDRNQGMSAVDTALVSSMGNNGLSTLVALNGGLGASSNNGGQGLFGGSSSTNNLVSTMVVANALAPQSSTTNNAATNVATLALLSQDNGNGLGF